MIEAPILVELLSERQHNTILSFLEARFGDVPNRLTAKLRKITDEKKLIELARHAALCSDLKSFESHLRKPRKA